jgi:hypothetical protein
MVFDVNGSMTAVAVAAAMFFCCNVAVVGVQNIMGGKGSSPAIFHKVLWAGKCNGVISRHIPQNVRCALWKFHCRSALWLWH